MDGIVQAEAQRTGVPIQVIRAVIRQESAHNPGAVSNKGAQGLMQLMPGTAARFGVHNPFDPAENIRGGTTYLAWLYNRYQSWPLALAGYNAGEGAVDKYAGIPPYRETQNYVSEIMARLGGTTGDVGMEGITGTTGEPAASPYYAELYYQPEPIPVSQPSRQNRAIQQHKGQPSPTDLGANPYTASVFFSEGE